MIIFSGIMNAEYLAEIFQVGLLSFLRDRYLDGHRLQQDNDPKHASYLIEEFFKEHNVNWWPTPPESLDLNPIENVWGSLKQFLRNTYKKKFRRTQRRYSAILGYSYPRSVHTIHRSS